MSGAGPATAAEQPPLSPFAVAGRGAPVPFTELEAETAATSGSLIGPDRTYTCLPAEASGRRAVRLDAPGEYVEFTLTEPANAMTVRYALPDNAAGTGITAPVALSLDGTKLRDLDFTSEYAWFYGSYPFTNPPGEKPHHFYDETRALFGRTLAAGAKVRITLPSTGATPWAWARGPRRAPRPRPHRRRPTRTRVPTSPGRAPSPPPAMPMSAPRPRPSTVR